MYGYSAIKDKEYINNINNSINSSIENRESKILIENWEFKIDQRAEHLIEPRKPKMLWKVKSKIFYPKSILSILFPAEIKASLPRDCVTISNWPPNEI